MQQKASERKEIQDKINELNTKRLQHQKDEMTRRGLDSSKGFDAALRSAIREQAAGKGIQFSQ